jgi:hypothetical protein
MSNILDALTAGVAGYAALLAGISALATGLLEALKAALPIRARFHQKSIVRWTRGTHLSSDQLLMWVPFHGLPRAKDPNSVIEELLELAIGGTEYKLALYEQAPEKMFGQIQAAVNVALDFPSRAPALYAFVARDPNLPDSQSDQATWLEFSKAVNSGAVGVGSGQDPTPEARQFNLLGTQARTRIENLVRRRLDALQTRIDYRWARLNQISAFVIASGIAYYALSTSHPANMLANIALAALAGFLAPPAKSLVSALSSVRFK